MKAAPLAETVLRDDVLDEEVRRYRFPSGLTVYVVRKPEFAKSYATLAAHYGSVDTTVRANGRVRPLPDGIAHFLEHKVFETADGGDAFGLFAARGASANAFTSFHSTRYLFGTSAEYGANLRTLLEMVFDLHVSDESVEREKGIIGQEIAMYDDDPEWRIYFGALQALYHRHPLRIDIAGTAKTIQRIDADLLRAVHRAYYHPRNMVLAAVSPEPVRATLDAVRECVETRRFGRGPGARPAPIAEPATVRRRRLRLALPVARPKLILAFKDRSPGGSGRTRLRHEIASGLALDCLFGSSGSIFLDLYEQGLVDEHFSGSYTLDRDYAFGMVGGETDDDVRLGRELERRLDAALATGLSREEFDRVRNKELGGYARAFNAPERVAHLLVGHHLRGTRVTDHRELLGKVTHAEVNRRMRELLAPRGRCYSVVVPR